MRSRGDAKNWPRTPSPKFAASVGLGVGTSLPLSFPSGMDRVNYASSKLSRKQTSSKSKPHLTFSL